MGHKFKTSDKVIVRDTNDRLIWRFDLFSHYNSNDSIHQYVTIGGVWECCLPYEGNEHLIGSIRDPEEKQKPFEWGEKLIYTAPLSKRNTECVFLFMTENGAANIHCVGDDICTLTKIENLRRPTEG